MNAMEVKKLFKASQVGGEHMFQFAGGGRKRKQEPAIWAKATCPFTRRQRQPRHKKSAPCTPVSVWVQN